MPHGRRSPAADRVIGERFPRAFALGALGAAVLGAAILPGNPPGLGLVIVALAVAAAVRQLQLQLSPHDAVCACFSIVFMTLFVIRDSFLVLLPAFLGALAFASLATAGGEGWIGLARGATRAGILLPGGLVRALRSLAPRRPPPQGLPALRGAGLGLLLLAVFGSLFASADAAFAHIAGEVLTPDIGVGLLPMRLIMLIVVLGIAGSLGWALLIRREGNDEPMAVAVSPRFERLEWSVALGLLNALFGAFVILQIAVLFGGRAHVVETAGLTYAEYARAGFFQLVAVAFLVLVVIAATVVWVRPADRSEHLLLRTLQGLLCVLTLVILASALRRLDLYQDVFGLTRLRVSVQATILWLGAIFALILVAGINQGKWLPRAVLYVSAASFLIFAVSNPEARIAEQNVGRFERTSRIDLQYLETLSADAVPALTALPPFERACALSQIDSRVSDEESWLSFNAARSAARPTLEANKSQGLSCPEAF